MGDDSSRFFALIGVALGIAAHLPYFYSVMRGKTKPHVFSWSIWGLLNSIACMAQLSAHGGEGAWPTGALAVLCAAGGVLACWRGERRITKSDWVCLVACLAAIPVWLATHEPLAATLMVTVIDIVSFIPTYRKTWQRPHEELLTAYFLGSAALVCSLLAMGHYSWTTALYPAAIATTDMGFVMMALYRRRMIAEIVAAKRRARVRVRLRARAPLPLRQRIALPAA